MSTPSTAVYHRPPPRTNLRAWYLSIPRTNIIVLAARAPIAPQTAPGGVA